MYRSACVGLGVILSLAAVADYGCAEAQSLSDAVAASSGWQNSSEAFGAWQTEVTPEVAVRARDPLWTVDLLRAKPSRITTASLAPPSTTQKPDMSRGPRLTGLASYYGKGEVTATGEKFDPAGMTAAHRTLPFGTRVRVTRLDTGNSVVVRINDRGPFKPGRIIDLSEGAAENLGMMGAGLAEVRLDVLGR